MPGTTSIDIGTPVVIDRDVLDDLIAALRAGGRTVLGPRSRDGAIVNEPVAGMADMAVGLGDEQEGGYYRLVERDDGKVFGHTVAPQGWKRELHPPRVKLFSSHKKGDGFAIEPAEDDFGPTAFLGVRPCELKAIQIQDKVFDTGEFEDSTYYGRRDKAFIVAVNCTHAGKTCFCASMNAGPAAEAGYDIVLTEIVGDGAHRFVAEAGTHAGADVLGAVTSTPAAEADTTAAAKGIEDAREQMGRSMKEDHRDLLARNVEHPRWEEVAERCLNCANCTMVCPTCFCTTVEDITSLDGEHAERWRTWDSCFSVDFSYIHGGAIRPNGWSRYRQWMTHKLSSWYEQFGTSGCVGCGRCITWCPVGIDITEETAAIADDDRGGESKL